MKILKEDKDVTIPVILKVARSVLSGQASQFEQTAYLAHEVLMTLISQGFMPKLALLGEAVPDVVAEVAAAALVAIHTDRTVQENNLTINVESDPENSDENSNPRTSSQSNNNNNQEGPNSSQEESGWVLS